MANEIDPGNDVNRPTLVMAGGWPHDYTGTPDEPGGGSGNEQWKGPDNGRFHINLASMLDAERTINLAMDASTYDYNTLKNFLNEVAPSDNPWIFASKYSGQTGGGGGGATSSNSPYSAGWTFADPPESKTNGSENILDPKVQALLHQQDRLLLAVADAIAYSGAFVYAIDQAGQLYSRADKASFAKVGDYTISP